MIQQEAIRDARTLGGGKMFTLGLQHMFAMFGATVLVPVITGLSMSATLLFAGVGTLLFHLCTKFKVPAFLGSSFAFLGGYAAVVQIGAAEGLTAAQSLPYACIGVFCAGLVYFVVAGLFAAFGPSRVMRFFPPVVTGPIIIAIGLTLSGSAISNCQQNWWIAILAMAIIVVCSIWGKGMIKIIPILLGVLGSYIVAACFGLCDFSAVRDAAWIGLPFRMENTAIAVFRDPNWGLVVAAIIAIIPISLATMMEHIGDMCAISSTVGVNFLQSPGLHRTLMGDGLATALASLFGAPANTTYGENTGVLNLTRVYDPRVIRIAACLAIVLSFCPKFSAVISAMPAATIGGVSLVLYGMISAVGVRNIVENKVDFKASRNVIVAALILVLAIGIKYGANDQLSIGFTSLSGLAVAAIVGVILNAILPGKDYSFDAAVETSMSLDDVKKKLRTVPDYPVKGILFWDVTTIFKDPDALKTVIDSIYEIYKDKGITKVVGIESRGFVVGSALAEKLGAGFVPARKPGKLPAETVSESYDKEYGKDTIEIHVDAISPDDVVLVHDDLLATGGTVEAVNRLVRRFSPKAVYDNFIIELPALKGREHISSDVDVTAIFHLEGD